jgi:nitroimidazol reductase NimA-like FMN-containing flavoprotein (pyridoxamine 5'-phosphate oxidase superfamily)
VDGHPEIYPVNFVLERRSIVFRTAPVTKLWESAKQERAAFEIDGYEPSTQEAWSVIVRGTTSLIEDPDERSTVNSLGLEPWEPGTKTPQRQAVTARPDRTAVQGQRPGPMEHQAQRSAPRLIRVAPVSNDKCT